MATPEYDNDDLFGEDDGDTGVDYSNHQNPPESSDDDLFGENTGIDHQVGQTHDVVAPYVGDDLFGEDDEDTGVDYSNYQNPSGPSDEDLFGENTGADYTVDRNPPTKHAQAEEKVDADQQRADEQQIAALLAGDLQGNIPGLDENEPIDQRNKAADAIDYEDLSDDDLPDEEPGKASSGDAPGLTDDGGTPNDTTDDLFGEDDDPSTFDNFGNVTIQNDNEAEGFDNDLKVPSPPVVFRDVNFADNFDTAEEEKSEVEKMQAAKAICPQFELGSIPYINEWFPIRQAYYNPKDIVRKDKVTHPKISLEIAPDQEKAFRSAGPGFTTNRLQLLDEAAARGYTLDLSDEEEPEIFDAIDYTPLDEDDAHGPSGATNAEVRMHLFQDGPIVPPQGEPIIEEDFAAEDAWLLELGEQPQKKQKLHHALEFIDQPYYPVPNFDNFAEQTAQIGARVIIDLNDPDILVAPVETQSKRLANGSLKYGTTAKKSIDRYNISNDKATEALKLTNQSKVRATMAKIEIEHSLPALKCAWPYYKVKRQVSELRAFHRLPMKWGKFLDAPQHFSKSINRKRKNMRGLTPKEVFSKTSELSMNDNTANAMLLEYSEEIPTVLSHFGMGNKIVHYYRKLDTDDKTRPKPAVGETRVLFPNDESPFGEFGEIKKGEMVSTLHNSMYRAPVFKHDPKPNDFLVVRNTTGINGTDFFLHKIDHLYCVGQEMPSVEVPGPHSRKVTTANKNRMTMISFRIIKHSKNHDLKVGEITNHMDETNDMQNRQKLKEILKYNKDAKVWQLKEDVSLAEEDIRAMVAPEDICLIDAMYVGTRQLEDAGYAQASHNPSKEYEDQEKDTDTLEQQLAPWRTTKAFLEASAKKAMLELKGPGDPSGCGIAISMIKTSMKGGFIKNLQNGPMGTSADAMERTKKANGGHDYNVQQQTDKYNEVLAEIWQAQRDTLSDAVEHTEMDAEDQQEEAEQRQAQTPAPPATPANFDDLASMASEARGNTHLLRITRQFVNQFGELETEEEVVQDNRVAKEYMRRRAAKELENVDIYHMANTGDPERDRQMAQAAQRELARLQHNKERREHRERLKKNKLQSANSAEADVNSPGPATPATSDVNIQGSQLGAKVEKGKKPKTIPGQTIRKCANCGASGHIKTNRKLCPMFNGEWVNGQRSANRGTMTSSTPTPSFSNNNNNLNNGVTFGSQPNSAQGARWIVRIPVTIHN